LFGVIRHNRQLVGKVAIGTQHDEVSDFCGQILAEPPLQRILETNLTGLDLEPPGARFAPRRPSIAASPRIARYSVRTESGIATPPCRRMQTRAGDSRSKAPGIAAACWANLQTRSSVQDRLAPTALIHVLHAQQHSRPSTRIEITADGGARRTKVQGPPAKRKRPVAMA
jgi:hypothetical protein